MCWITAMRRLRQSWLYAFTRAETRTSPAPPDVGVSQAELLAAAGPALLQTVGVAGLAAQIADGLVEAVRQHGQLAAMTQGAGSAARTATMLAAVGLLETEETYFEEGRRRDRGSELLAGKGQKIRRGKYGQDSGQRGDVFIV